MPEVLYYKSGLFGRRTELHIAPEGLTLVGRAGPGSVEYAPIGDLASVALRKGR